MKVYLIGKVTGLEREAVEAKFNKVEELFTAGGMEVVNPIKLIPETEDNWCLAMRKCIAALVSCDAYFIFPDAYDSRGGNLEIQIADALDLTEIVL
jgi:hypothetical protein